MFGLQPIQIGAKLVWFSAVIGIASYLAGVFVANGAARFGVVVFSIFVGGAAQLWLTEPLWYPAIQLRPKSVVDAVMFGLIAAQGIVAIWVLFRAGAHQKTGQVLRQLGPTKIVLFLMLSFAFSVSVQGYLPRGFVTSYGLHLIAASSMVTLNLLSAAALLNLPAPALSVKLPGPKILAVLVLFASALLAYFGFERLPHVEDEAVYLFQAQTFAKLSLDAPAPDETLRSGLEFYLLEIRDGRWFSPTPPGWPTLLAIGVFLGQPWLINPLLGALSILLAHGVARQLTDTNRADIVILLMATSPWFIQSSASMMPHNTAIALTLTSWWLLLKGPVPAGRVFSFALLAGMAMGWVFVTRQLEGVILGTLTGAWLLWSAIKGEGLTRTAAFSIGAVLTGSVYLAHNYAMTGDILHSPLARYLDMVWHAGANSYGFGAKIGPPASWQGLDVKPGHWPIEGLFNTLHNISMLQLELFGWGVGSLFLVFAFFIWGRMSRADFAMLTICLAIGGAMFFYWFSGGFYIGPRYWFGMFIPLLMLSAGGFIGLSRRYFDPAGLAQNLTWVLLVFCGFGLLAFTPWRGVEKFHGYNNYRSDIGRAAANIPSDNPLIFFTTPKNEESAVYLNDPFLPDDKPIFLKDLGPEQHQMVTERFPDRPSYYLTDPGNE